MLMERKGNVNLAVLFGFILFGILLAGLVGGTAPVWNDSKVSLNYSVNEDNLAWSHNLSADLNVWDGNIRFDFNPDAGQLLYWVNSSGTFSFTSMTVVSSWINITNASTGNLVISARYDNQTGWFKVPIKATNQSDTQTAPTTVFNFIINATNDAPNFTSAVNSSYTAPISSGNYSLNLYASDEEMHYPLTFNYTVSNCSVSVLSSRYNVSGDGNNNCTLAISNATLSQTSYQINFTGLTSNDAGVYNLSVCVMDNATANSSRIPLYTVADYNDTKFTCKNISLNIKSTLTVTSNCS